MANEQTATKTSRKPNARKAASIKGPASTPSRVANPAAPLKAGVSYKVSSAKVRASNSAGGNIQGVPTEQIKAQMEQLKTQAGEASPVAAETSKVKTSRAMHGLAKLINDTAGTVDEKMGHQYGDYARHAAEVASEAARSLDAKDLELLVTEARDFFRKSPAVAIAAAAVIGFMLMRMVKESSDKA